MFKLIRNNIKFIIGFILGLFVTFNISALNNISSEIVLY